VPPFRRSKTGQRGQRGPRQGRGGRAPFPLPHGFVVGGLIRGLGREWTLMTRLLAVPAGRGPRQADAHDDGMERRTYRNRRARRCAIYRLLVGTAMAGVG